MCAAVLQPVSERPFAIDAFSRVQALTHHLSVIRNLHRYNHNVNVGRSDEFICTLEGSGQTKGCCRSPRARKARISYACKLKIIR
jgi:hypothetical protein